MASITTRRAAGDLSDVERKELNNNMDKRFGATNWGAAFLPFANQVPGTSEIRQGFTDEADAIRRRRKPSLIDVSPSIGIGGRQGYGGRETFG